jgi:hypothetical protein
MQLTNDQVLTIVGSGMDFILASLGMVSILLVVGVVLVAMEMIRD